MKCYAVFFDYMRSSEFFILLRKTDVRLQRRGPIPSYIVLAKLFGVFCMAHNDHKSLNHVRNKKVGYENESQPTSICQYVTKLIT